MTRLYVKVWLALVAAVFVSLVGGALTARAIGGPSGPLEPSIRAYAVGMVRDLPEDRQRRDRRLAEIAETHQVGLTLYARDRRTVLAQSGPRPLPPPGISPDDHWVRGRRGAGMAIALDDGRWVVVGHPHPGLPALVTHLLPALAVFFGLLAAAAWPIARMTTRRLEELRGAVEDLGHGELSRRVPVQGTDEVAELARSFNASAGRIEALVEGQRRVLASASHELRSPLTRIRMAAELARQADPEERARLLDGVEGDITELDQLIDDVLLSSRLDAGAAEPPEDEVDLGILARQEAERTGATVTGEGVAIGDVRMLRRALRNLLENAARHGEPPVTVDVDDGRLTVTDRGPGIPESERQAVFEPFYRPQGHRESDGGVGLGLALVQRIARHHQGTVTIDGGPGGSGTAITLSWPARP